VFFVLIASTAIAAVEIDFADGRKETFVSASVENGKLKCTSRYGTVPLSPTALGAISKARYFPELADATPPPQAEVLVQTPNPAPAPPATPTPIPNKPKTEAKSFFTSFEGKLKELKHDLIKYPQPLNSAQFFIHIPAGYGGTQPYGRRNQALIPAGELCKWARMLNIVEGSLALGLDCPPGSRKARRSFSDRPRF
jgi:hypothetical protein